MKLKLLAGVAAVVAFSATGAMAQNLGWYGAVDLGYHWPKEIDVDTANAGTFEIDPNNGWAGFGRLGYQMSPNIRAEGELGYRPSDIDEADADVAGKAELWTGMLNVIWDVLP